MAAAGLLVNAVGLSLLHRDREHHLNTRGAYLHILGDLLGSVGALIAAIILLTTGWTLADPIISVLIAVLILGGAWRLVRESTDILLEAVPGHVSMPEVQRRMLAVPGVSAVHDLHVWTVTSGMVAMSGHAVVPELADHPDVLSGIREAMGDLGIGHVTVQLEVRERCGEADRAVKAGRRTTDGVAAVRLRDFNSSHVSLLAALPLSSPDVSSLSPRVSSVRRRIEAVYPSLAKLPKLIPTKRRNSRLPRRARPSTMLVGAEIAARLSCAVIP